MYRPAIRVNNIQEHAYGKFVRVIMQLESVNGYIHGCSDT